VSAGSPCSWRTPPLVMKRSTWPVAVRVEEDGADVVGVLGVGPGLLRRGLEGSVGLAEVKDAGLAAGAADEHVGHAVAVHVGDRDRGAAEALAPREEPLALNSSGRLGGVGEVDPARVRVLDIEGARVHGRGGGRAACGPPLPGRARAALTVSSVSTGRSSRTCTWPFGQWIVSFEMTVSSPRPKWTSKARWRRRRARCRSGGPATPEAVSIRSSAPMASRFGARPVQLEHHPVALGRVVADDRRGAVVVVVDDVEDAAAVQVHQGAPEGDAELVQAPLLRSRPQT
jgi:hypothetical protein